MSDSIGMTQDITVHRIAEFEVGDGDGRTLYTRIVPWNTPATVADPPHFQPYQESWAAGAFDKQLRAANRVNVLMNFEHQQGIGGVVGRGIELRSESDGLHGVFRMLSSQDADKALELVREEILTGLSLEAHILRSDRADGQVVRTDARLRNVALCRATDSGYVGPKAAFAGAQVLAVRSSEDSPPDEDPPPAAMTRERIVIPEPLDVARLEALGMKVPKHDDNPSEEDG